MDAGETVLTTYTLADIQKLRPCYDPVKYNREQAALSEILDITECPPKDRVWVVSQLVPRDLRIKFASWCAVRARFHADSYKGSHWDYAAAATAYAAAYAAADTAAANAAYAAANAAYAAAYAANAANAAYAAAAYAAGEQEYNLQIEKLKELINGDTGSSHGASINPEPPAQALQDEGRPESAQPAD